MATATLTATTPACPSRPSAASSAQPKVTSAWHDRAKGHRGSGQKRLQATSSSTGSLPRAAAHQASRHRDRTQ
jgi:hypothetical protein